MATEDHHFASSGSIHECSGRHAGARVLRDDGLGRFAVPPNGAAPGDEISALDGAMICFLSHRGTPSHHPFLAGKFAMK